MDDDTNEQCYGVIPTIIAKCGSFLKEEGTAQPQLVLSRRIAESYIKSLYFFLSPMS